MASNFTITSKTAGQAQIMSGEAEACVDQVPTGSWLEVAFGGLTEPGGGAGERVCHVSTDVALRFRVKAGAPAGSDAGSYAQAGGERTISFPAGSKLWIK